jgi:hypothetical protein
VFGLRLSFIVVVVVLLEIALCIDAVVVVIRAIFVCGVHAYCYFGERIVNDEIANEWRSEDYP